MNNVKGIILIILSIFDIFLVFNMLFEVVPIPEGNGILYLIAVVLLSCFLYEQIDELD